ncbi:universal stress protein [Nigerium massiliense]|uniref:universal stress protein n=1 Tax=Nigerium massiliense TaxID=1522317 RepID=UPI00058F3991|nr:universal stress protein [Nigerium massiliense]
MSIVVGYGPQERGREALELGKALAHSLDESMVVCTVVLDRWQVDGLARGVDRQYQGALTEMARDVLDDAKSALAGENELSIDFEVVAGLSVAQALIDEAHEREARMCVLGSSLQSRWGELAIGSVSQRLMVSSPVPIAVAPRGYRVQPEGRLERVVLGVDPERPSEEAALAAAVLAADAGAELHLISFATGEKEGMWRRGLGEVERAHLYQEHAGKLLKSLAGTINGHPSLPAVASYRVLHANGWREALDKAEFRRHGDMLVVASSNAGPLEQLFLGSSAMRIIKHSPVPVLVLPKASLHGEGTAVVDLDEQA